MQVGRIINKYFSILEQWNDYNESALKNYFGYKLQSDIELKQLAIDSVKEYHERDIVLVDKKDL